jgi:hypothetical protein
LGGQNEPRHQGELLAILREAQTLICRPGNDFVWSGWDNAEEAAAAIASHLAAVEREDTSRLSALRLLFAPTGPIQEVSISSDWSDEFLALASRFDKASAEATP